MKYDLFNFGSSTSASAFGVSVYEDRADKWWAKLTVVPVYRVGNAVLNGWFWVRRRVDPEYQHHIIRTGLEPGWYDCDTLMLHGCFTLLVRYVEWECDGADELDKWSADLLARPDPNAGGASEAQAARQLGATELYRWWKVSKPADEARRDEMCHALFGNHQLKSEPVPGTSLHKLVFEEFEGDRKRLHDEFRALEDKIDREEQEMLHRLIDLRRSLWT